MVAYIECAESEEDFDESEIHVTKLQARPPYVCASLRHVKGKEKLNSTFHKSYSFDIIEDDQIFNILLKDKQTIFPEGKKILSIEEIKSRKFCKFHEIVGHSTNNYVHFKDSIQKVIKDGRLKFEEKSNPMKVDTKPFDIDSNYFELVTTPIGMVGLGSQEFDERKLQDGMSLDFFKNTKRPIYPKLGENLLEMLTLLCVLAVMLYLIQMQQKLMKNRKKLKEAKRSKNLKRKLLKKRLRRLS